jgi:2'-5' RNA ligase
MTKVHTSAVVIIPPEEIWKPIQDIRNTHDRHVHRWMPHITLLYPFRPKSEFPDLEIAFSNACNQIEPFEISLRKFYNFNHGRQFYTIWLAPEPNNLLVNLQHELMHIVPDCNDVNKIKSGYIPHLSVGQVKGKGNLIKLMNELQTSWKELEFTLKRINFISREKAKNSGFQIVKKIDLKI